MHAKVRTAVRMPVRILGFASSQFAVRILEQPGLTLRVNYPEYFIIIIIIIFDF